jgi:hypothetical protein
MEKRYIVIVFLTLLTSLMAASPTQAQLIAGSSAAVTRTEQISTSRIQAKDLAIKRKALVEVLKKYDAPLLTEVDSFMEACITYDLDCYLLPSITGVESTFGRFLIPGTYNPFGWGRGLIPFQSYHEAIMTVGKGLRENYINKGADTIEAIGAIYCEGNTWSGKVQFFHKAFAAEEEKQLFFVHDPVQL